MTTYSYSLIDKIDGMLHRFAIHIFASALNIPIPNQLIFQEKDVTLQYCF